MSIKIPYVRKGISSTLIALSAAIALLLSSLVLPLSHFLLQPAQAQSNVDVSFETTAPATGIVQCSNTRAYITFDAQGTATNDNSDMNLTGGTFQVTNSSDPDAQVLYSGKIISGSYDVDNGRILIILSYTPDHFPSSGPICVSTEKNTTFNISTVCNPDIRNAISADWQNWDSGHHGHFGDFNGGFSCSGLSPPSSSSSSTTTGTTAQD